MHRNCIGCRWHAQVASELTRLLKVRRWSRYLFQLPRRTDHQANLFRPAVVGRTYCRYPHLLFGLFLFQVVADWETCGTGIEWRCWLCINYMLNNNEITSGQYQIGRNQCRVDRGDYSSIWLLGSVPCQPWLRWSKYLVDLVKSSGLAWVGIYGPCLKFHRALFSRETRPPKFERLKSSA